MSDTKLNPSSSRSVSLLGCGWLGVPLAQKLLLRGFSVMGSTTHSDRLSVLSSIGLIPVLLRLEGDDADDSLAESHQLKTFFESQTLLIGVPPNSSLGPDYHLNQLKAILRARKNSGRSQNLIYISSTSVYGDSQTDVDETTQPSPSRESGEIQFQAEKHLLENAKIEGFGLTIVRAAGLIGPGRHPGFFLQGRHDVIDGNSPINLIHQEDLAESLALLIENPSPQSTRIFNAVARSHPTREEFYTRASSAVGVEPPTFKASVAKTGKIISGELLREVTGYSFRHDDLLLSLGISK